MCPLIWNIVPWYVGDGQGRIRPVQSDDIQAALPHLGSLLATLQALEVIVLVGKKTQSAAPQIRLLTSLPLILTHHPSARVFNLWPQKRTEAEAHFASIALMLGGGCTTTP